MADVFFNGPAGRIEGRYHQSSNSKAPVALVLHPHPLHGGTMNNKVVYGMYKSLCEAGLSVLRINFRGVGKSQGEYDGGSGELTDAATALDWLQVQNVLSDEYWVCGFSFGAWIATQLIMRRPEIARFVVVSPPVNKYDFSFLSPCPISGLIVQGTMDSIVVENDVSSLAKKLNNAKNVDIKYVSIDGADHFFRDKIMEFESVIKNYAMGYS